jgi:hypothetical protein
MKYLLLAFSVFLLFTTCKKYPDGGYTKRGPKNIIETWKLSLYEVNGIDSTDLINYNNIDDYKRISFQKNASTISISAPHSGALAMDFAESNQKLIFGNSAPVSGTECILYQNVNYCYRSFLIPEGTQNQISVEWTIKRLTKNEIHLSLVQKNNYKIILVK